MIQSLVFSYIACRQVDACAASSNILRIASISKDRRGVNQNLTFLFGNAVETCQTQNSLLPNWNRVAVPWPEDSSRVMSSAKSYSWAAVFSLISFNHLTNGTSRSTLRGIVSIFRGCYRSVQPLLILNVCIYTTEEALIQVKGQLRFRIRCNHLVPNFTCIIN